jgi:hypothetical protein
MQAMIALVAGIQYFYFISSKNVFLKKVFKVLKLLVLEILFRNSHDLSKKAKNVNKFEILGKNFTIF